MPDAKKVREVLAGTGYPEYKSYPPKPGQLALEIAGFRIQVSKLERRSLHVFHVGKGERIAVPQYEKALVTAGYIVTRHRRGGLKVANSENSAGRRHNRV